jgi:hypothetical protein
VTFRPDLVPPDYPVSELFGFPPDADTDAARAARAARACPFKGGECTKLKQAAGTAICSVRYRAEGFGDIIWATCANRLAGEFDAVRRLAFGDRADDARIVREVKIKNPSLSFDGVVLLVEPDGETRFVGIEAQTIDTRGGAVKPMWEAYAEGRPDEWRARYPARPTFGVNSANVWKRLLPQIINKGRMYADWETRLYVIVQGSLLQFIRRRMTLHELSVQEASLAEIVWLPWDYSGGRNEDGSLCTALGEPVMTTLGQVEQALTTVAAAQRPVFVAKALAKLERDDKAVRLAKQRAAAEVAAQDPLLVDDDLRPD